jgi:hypothetical protein
LYQYTHDLQFHNFTNINKAYIQKGFPKSSNNINFTNFTPK